MHLSAIPLGEMRTCTFCGSRLRAWYLLVGNPYKPSFATVTGWGVDPRYMVSKQVRTCLSLFWKGDPGDCIERHLFPQLKSKSSCQE